VLRHIALFRRKPEATAADVSRVEAALHQLPTYANHPDHQAVIQNLIRPIMAQREAIQYVIDHAD
jgi:hypothetical protein